MNRVTERFLKYVKIDTTADGFSDTFPSTAIQLDLAKVLRDELKALGLNDVLLDENGYVTATLPSNAEKDIDSVGFSAHFDTSDAFTGKNVKPQIHQNYDGQDVELNQDVTMKVADFPILKTLKGHDLITTDGTTLLGSDDKAGLAEIMELLTVLTENASIQHGDIKVLFTPDEEVGRGTDRVNLDNFKVDYAYTVDGGAMGEVDYENFNAANMTVDIQGLSIHPGTAKDKMINALQVGIDFHNLLPSDQVPEKTESYEGFFHLTSVQGDAEKAKLHYIIRDHDMALFEDKKTLAQTCAKKINEAYSYDVITLNIADSYYNMKTKIEPVYHIIENVEKAMRKVGVKPISNPIRGGTDGARLSFMGIPTPNICTGGGNFHGKFEFNTVQNLQKTSDLLVELVKIIAS